MTPEIGTKLISSLISSHDTTFVQLVLQTWMITLPVSIKIASIVAAF